MDPVSASFCCSEKLQQMMCASLVVRRVCEIATDDVCLSLKVADCLHVKCVCNM